MKRLLYIAREEQGSALITILIISLIVSLFIGAVLGGIFLQSKFIQQDINRTKALYSAEQNIYQYLHTGEISDSFGTITTSDFGGYLLINSSTKAANQEIDLEVLVGAIPDSVFNYVLALKDTSSALNLAGTTTIIGDIATGSNQVSTSTFKGFLFKGTFDGEANKENMIHFFPKFNYESIESQLDTFESFFEDDLNHFSGNGLRGVTNAEESDTLYFEDSQNWQLEEGFIAPKKSVYIINGNLSISGNGSLGEFTTIVVRDTLRINSSIKGTHTLLSAGIFMEISGKVVLSGQLLTRGRVVLSDQAYLSYPSLVYASTETYLGKEKEVIHLQDESVVDGMILYPIETGVFNQEQFRIKIDEGATVRGSVYTQGQTELQGSVYGSVLTKQFYFYESPTTYINWLKDAVIDYPKRPQDFVTPIGFSDSTKFALLDWRIIE